MAIRASGSRRARLLGGVGVGVVVLLLAAGLRTMAWGDGLAAQQRLLPGTTVAGVDVGDRTVADAVAALQERVATRLDRTIEVHHGDRTWTTTPRRLGATSDLEQVVAAAFQRTRRADVLDLARVWLGVGGAAHDVAVDVPRAPVADLVAGIADQVDAPPRDARVAWVDGAVQVEDAATGVRVRQDAAVAAVEDAVTTSAARVALPVEDWPPAFGTAAAQQVADEVGGVVAAALDHAVTVSLQGTTRTITPRGLGARHNAPDLLAARGATPDDVGLAIPDEAIDAVVDEVATAHEVAAVDAALAWSPSGGFAATPGSTGLRVDRDAARDAVRSALHGGTDRVALELQTTQPDITTADFDEVLLVRQGARRVELHRGGQVVRSWSVAVGTSGHPTPTGMFTIGAKRFEPTWHNSSPDGWGADMPDMIGPGPDNPLGLRALNWVRDGVDTLIRFHGTANEASIGRAASHGCVRMTNPDVIELFDLVDSGTVIVSVAA